MVATVKHIKKRTTTKKSSAKKTKLRFIIAGLVIAVFFGGICYLSGIKHNQHDKTVATQPQNNVKDEPKKPEIHTYNYTEILENKEIDTGSGVKITRNYEAEQAARDAEYFKKIAEKKRLIREAKEREEEEKLKKAREKQEAIERNRLAKASQLEIAQQKKQVEAQAKAAGKTAAEIKNYTKNSIFITCGNNYRTENDAESDRAKLALKGINVFIYKHQVGGGYAYSLSLGPYKTNQEANNERIKGEQTGILRDCTRVK